MMWFQARWEQRRALEGGGSGGSNDAVFTWDEHREQRLARLTAECAAGVAFLARKS